MEQPKNSINSTGGTNPGDTETINNNISVDPPVVPKLSQEDLSTITRELGAIFNDGIEFTIVSYKQGIIRKLLLKLRIYPREKRFIIYPMCLGTLGKISGVLCSMDVDTLINIDNSKDTLLKVGLETIHKNKDSIIKVIGYAITGRGKNPSKWLLRYLNSNLTATEMLKLFTIIIQQLGINDFLAGTVSITGINLFGTGKETEDTR